MDGHINDDDDDDELIEVEGSTATNKKDLELELSQLDKEVAEISRKIQKLEGRKRILKRKAELIKERLERAECEALKGQDWESGRFSWSERLDVARQEVFGLSSYRQDQLRVMNASMSGHDCLLIMPTGRGSSQLLVSILVILPRRG